MKQILSVGLLLLLVLSIQGCNFDDLKEIFEEESKDDVEMEEVIELESKYMPPALPSVLESKYMPPALTTFKK